MACKYVPIPKEDTYELIKKAQKGDEAAKTLLVEQNTGLVKKIALKFTASEYETEDLIQIGYMGLMKAVEKFNPEFDVMFSTYAVPMIMGELKRFFRDNGRIKVSRNLKSEMYMLRQLQEEHAAKEGEVLRVSQAAEKMGISCEHVLEIMEAQDSLQNVASLDSQAVEQEYEQKYQGAASPEQFIDGMMLKKEISALKAKERQVILLRYYRDMTQQEIADILKISQVQVSRIEKKALAKMRSRIAE